MALDINALRAAFKTTDTTDTGAGLGNNYYPFWNMPVGERAIVRFVKDKDDTNPLGFLREKLTHSLSINGENKTIPCLKMYDEDCPICKVSSAYYKDNDKINGKKYWRKKSHLAQVIVIEDPLPADDSGETHEGKLRYISLGYQLFNVIKEAFEGGELDVFPYSYEGGYNFTIKKTKQGDYDGYAVGSAFARKATDLTGDEVELAEDQMIELVSLLPQKPELEKVEGMLEAALTGSSYTDSASSAPADGASSLTLKNKAAPAAPAAKKADVPEMDGAGDMSEAEALLAKIRARREAE